MNVCFETFGCRLSRAEALDDEARAIVLGHVRVKKHADADLIVVRGCSVTSRAQADCERLISHLRRKYPTKRVIVTGCLPGAQKNYDFPSGKRENASEVSTNSGVPTRTARAYLKVQDGCAGTCTFCIVPKFRGAAVSEDFNALIDKAKRFVDAGYHEIVVTGCNLALYANGGKRLPELLDALAGVDADCRIRLGSLEPWGCADEVVDVVATHENICRYLHLPVQSGSDMMLRQMNRPYRIADVERIVEKARRAMPLIGLGCDLMAGFPGESEIDLVQTKNMLIRLAFSNLHTFPYSERPGTPAASMKNVVRRHIRSERAHMLDGIAKANRARFARRFVGKEVEVVIESHAAPPNGWTSEYLWFEGPLHSTIASRHEELRKRKLRFVVRSANDGILHGVPVTHGR